MRAAEPSRRRKMCIAWRKPTRRSPTIAGKEKGNKDWCHRERSSCNPARRQKGCGEHGTSIQTRGHPEQDRKSTRLNSSHMSISYAVFCLKKKKKKKKAQKKKKNRITKV